MIVSFRIDLRKGVMFMEPHYHLPLLSLMPRPLAHRYLRLADKGDYYHEQHVSYWALKQLCDAFVLHDYSYRVIAEPERFSVDYMLAPGSLKWRIAMAISKHLKWATPHIWILQKATVA